MPSNIFKSIWNVILIFLLIYTATYMPYKTCFIYEPSQASEIVDTIVDALFTFDILVNFLSAIELSDGTLEYRPRKIAANYIKTWFFFDLIAVLPVQLFINLLPAQDAETMEIVDEEGNIQTMIVTSNDADYNQLVRLVRLPRLYRMVRILRVIKIIKVARRNRVLQRITRALKMKAAIMRMIQGLISAVLVTHIFACFWFLCASTEDLGPDTWVYKKNLVDEPTFVQYLWAMHWATQTVTTVGYGDVPAYTTQEILLSFVWMLVGVAFYSFIIGNFSSIITSHTALQQSVQFRVAGLAELSRKAKIPYSVTKKIKTFIENNFKSLFNQDDEAQLVQMLPPSLRDEILRITYGEIIGKINFFYNMKDKDFLWKILPVLRSIKLEKSDVQFWKGDTPDELYFIQQGTIKIYNDENVPFVKYTQGDMFGDSDALLDLPRDGKAVAMSLVMLKSLHISQFQQLFFNSQDTCLQMIVQAKRKRDRHELLQEKAKEKKAKSLAIQQKKTALT